MDKYKFLLISIFFLLILVLCEQSSFSEEPIYLWITAEFGDFINYELSSDCLLKYMEIWQKLGIKGDIILSGLMAEQLARKDLLKGISFLDFGIGYKGEESNGPSPVLVDYYSAIAKNCGYLLDGLTIPQMLYASTMRYTHHLNPLSGQIEWNIEGGIKAVAKLFNKPLSIVSSRPFEAAPAAIAFRMIPEVKKDAIEFGLSSLYFEQNRHPEAGSLFFALLGGETCWYMGFLNFNPDPFHYSEAFLDLLDNNRPHLVLKNINDTATYALINVWEYAYNNSQWGCFPPSMEAAKLPDIFIKTPKQIEAYIKQYKESLLNLLQFYLPANPRVKLVNSNDILELVENSYDKMIDKETIFEIALYLGDVSVWKNEEFYGPEVKRPPLYVKLQDGRNFSLSEAFYLLAYALKHFKDHHRLPEEVKNRFYFGPWEMEYPANGCNNEGALITGTAIVNSVSEFMESGLPWLPAKVIVSGFRLNTAEFLFLLAREYLDIYLNGSTRSEGIISSCGNSFAEPVLRMIFPCKDLEPLYQSNLQMWTFKPAIWKDLSDLSPSRPRILYGGFSGTTISSRYGGTFKVQALVYDPDGEEDIRRVMLFSDGDYLGFDLHDDGQEGDLEKGDHIFTFQTSIQPGMPAGLYTIQIVAEDKGGNLSAPWPYLHIFEGLDEFYPRILNKEKDKYKYSRNRGVRSGNHKQTYNRDAPIIEAAGFKNTVITSTAGGCFWIEAYVRDAQSLGDIMEVQIYLEDQPTGILLFDNGIKPDKTAGDGWFSGMVNINGPVPADDYEIRIIARDFEGNESIPWPYFLVEE